MWNCVKHFFWVKKVVGKNFFKNWNFYPSEGSELIKKFEKWGWKFFLRFLEMLWNMFCEWKNLLETLFSKIEILSHRWKELVKFLGKWGPKIFNAFSLLFIMRTC